MSATMCVPQRFLTVPASASAGEDAKPANAKAAQNESGRNLTDLTVEDFAASLRDARLRAGHYHGRQSRRLTARTQPKWISEPGGPPARGSASRVRM